jgi:hypothetical protein
LSGLTAANGDIPYFTAAGTMSILDASAASEGDVLTIASGVPVYTAPSANAVSQSTTTLTSSDTISSISSGAKMIVVSIQGASPSVPATNSIQLGDSGGVETSGYTGGAISPSGTELTWSTGATIGTQAASTNGFTGNAVLVNVPSTDVWVITGVVCYEGDPTETFYFSGTKTLSGTLDRVKYTISTGSLDAGSMTVTVFE